MHLTLTLCLPRDEMTVPVARHVVRSSMREVGVEDDCIASIEIALSEACTNVLKHSGPGDEYEVSLEVDTRAAILRVIDTGRGFDFNSLAGGNAEVSAEQGRGVEMMRALVDRVEFQSVPEAGTIVHLEKVLEFTEGSALQKLARNL